MNDHQTLSRYSSLATAAILESLSNKPEGALVPKVMQHLSDETFRVVIAGVAEGMGLRFMDCSYQNGMQLAVEDRQSLFAPNLTWLHRQLKLAGDEQAKEKRAVAPLALMAVLTCAFPNRTTLEMDWTHSSDFTVKEVLDELGQTAEQIITEAGRREDDSLLPLVSVAKVIHQERLPRYPDNPNGRSSVTRSQKEMVEAWIKLLLNHRLIAEDRGLDESDLRYRPSGKLKFYLNRVGHINLLETVADLKRSFIENTDAIAPEESP